MHGKVGVYNSGDIENGDAENLLCKGLLVDMENLGQESLGPFMPWIGEEFLG